jgi:hypothetical protein
MALKLADIRANRKTVSVEYQGASFNVVYKPAEITPAFLDTLAEMESYREALVNQVSTFAESWEVLDDQGKPIAPTPEFVETLPLDFLEAVMGAITKDRRGAGDDLKKS